MLLLVVCREESCVVAASLAVAVVRSRQRPGPHSVGVCNSTVFLVTWFVLIAEPFCQNELVGFALGVGTLCNIQQCHILWA